VGAGLVHQRSAGCPLRLKIQDHAHLVGTYARLQKRRRPAVQFLLHR
jgi:hypothetical protein